MHLRRTLALGLVCWSLVVQGGCSRQAEKMASAPRDEATSGAAAPVDEASEDWAGDAPMEDAAPPRDAAPEDSPVELAPLPDMVGGASPDAKSYSKERSARSEYKFEAFEPELSESVREPTYAIPDQPAVELSPSAAPAPQPPMTPIAPSPDAALDPAATLDVEVGAKAGDDADEPEFSVVKVFYGTDRESVVPSLITTEDILRNFLATIITLAFGLILLVAARVFRSRRWMLAGCGMVLVAIAMFLGYERLTQLGRMRTAAQRNSEYYTSELGELQYGTAEVSIPKKHKLGEIERPNIFRLEFKEDPAEHVVILQATPCSESRFLAELQEKVAQSQRRELFVFIHGYNVTFEHAVRRTAQVAFDMDFEGAPITYSWPSRGSLLGYSADVESVEYTVEHLKRFLTTIREHSGADSINLIAHSMGNRALTRVLKEFAQQQGDAVPDRRMFNEVVFAAPDVSAELFRQRVVNDPPMSNVANRLTLYASSNDKALLASKKVNGFHRAGESGEGLVVIQGVDTIDVSDIDLSILGHNYIGSSGPIIRDLRHLLLLRQGPEQRAWLRAASLPPNLRYWVYDGAP